MFACEEPGLSGGRHKRIQVPSDSRDQMRGDCDASHLLVLSGLDYPSLALWFCHRLFNGYVRGDPCFDVEVVPLESRKFSIPKLAPHCEINHESEPGRHGLRQENDSLGLDNGALRMALGATPFYATRGRPNDAALDGPVHHRS